MFDKDSILEFIIRIIDKATETNKKDIINNLIQFKEYLILTKMVDNDTLKEIEKIIYCANELINLKLKMGLTVDDMTKIINRNSEKEVKLKPVNLNRHYEHYGNSFSSSCGGSTSYRSGC